MASYGYTFQSGDGVTPTRLNDARTVSDIVNADIKSDAAIAGSKIAPNFGSQNVVTTGSVAAGTTSPLSGHLLHVAGPTLIRGAVAGTAAPMSSETTMLSVLNGATYNATPSVSVSIGASNFDGVNSNVPFQYVLTTPSTAGGASLAISARTFDGVSTYTRSERLRIDANGNVGIGASAPATTLEVRNPTGNTEYLRVGGGSLSERSLRFSAFVSNTVNNAGHDINAPEANGAITLSTVSTERLRIKTQGQVRFQPLASDPAGAEAGDVYYNSTSNKLRVRTNTAWVDLH